MDDSWDRAFGSDHMSADTPHADLGGEFPLRHRAPLSTKAFLAQLAVARALLESPLLLRLKFKHGVGRHLRAAALIQRHARAHCARRDAALQSAFQRLVAEPYVDVAVGFDVDLAMAAIVEAYGAWRQAARAALHAARVDEAAELKQREARVALTGPPRKPRVQGRRQSLRLRLQAQLRGTAAEGAWGFAGAADVAAIHERYAALVTAQRDGNQKEAVAMLLAAANQTAMASLADSSAATADELSTIVRASQLMPSPAEIAARSAPPVPFDIAAAAAARGAMRTVRFEVALTGVHEVLVLPWCNDAGAFVAAHRHRGVAFDGVVGSLTDQHSDDATAVDAAAQSAVGQAPTAAELEEEREALALQQKFLGAVPNRLSQRYGVRDLRPAHHRHRDHHHHQVSFGESDSESVDLALQSANRTPKGQPFGDSSTELWPAPAMLLPPPTASPGRRRSSTANMQMLLTPNIRRRSSACDGPQVEKRGGESRVSTTRRRSSAVSIVDPTEVPASGKIFAAIDEIFVMPSSPDARARHVSQRETPPPSPLKKRSAVAEAAAQQRIAVSDPPTTDESRLAAAAPGTDAAAASADDGGGDDVPLLRGMALEQVYQSIEAIPRSTLLHPAPRPAAGPAVAIARVSRSTSAALTSMSRHYRDRPRPAPVEAVASSMMAQGFDGGAPLDDGVRMPQTGAPAAAGWCSTEDALRAMQHESERRGATVREGISHVRGAFTEMLDRSKFPTAADNDDDIVNAKRPKVRRARSSQFSFALQRNGRTPDVSRKHNIPAAVTPTAEESVIALFSRKVKAPSVRPASASHAQTVQDPAATADMLRVILARDDAREARHHMTDVTRRQAASLTAAAFARGRR
jgi:hypothetical protein